MTGHQMHQPAVGAMLGSLLGPAAGENTWRDLRMQQGTEPRQAERKANLRLKSTSLCSHQMSNLEKQPTNQNHANPTNPPTTTQVFPATCHCCKVGRTFWYVYTFPSLSDKLRADTHLIFTSNITTATFTTSKPYFSLHPLPSKQNNGMLESV